MTMTMLSHLGWLSKIFNDLGRDPFVESETGSSFLLRLLHKWNWNRIRESGETVPYHGFAVETEKKMADSEKSETEVVFYRV